jgi:hypothetical protein
MGAISAKPVSPFGHRQASLRVAALMSLRNFYTWV